MGVRSRKVKKRNAGNKKVRRAAGRRGATDVRVPRKALLAALNARRRGGDAHAEAAAAAMHTDGQMAAAALTPAAGAGKKGKSHRALKQFPARHTIDRNKAQTGRGRSKKWRRKDETRRRHLARADAAAAAPADAQMELA